MNQLLTSNNALKVESIYSFDENSELLLHEMQKEEYVLKTGEPIPYRKILSDTEDGYYLRYIQTIDGIPVDTLSREKNGYIMPGFEIECIYTSNGIGGLVAGKELIIGSSVRTIQVADVYNVLDALKKKFNNLILPATYTVTLIEIKYITTAQETLLPIWEVFMQCPNFPDYRVRFYVDTCKEIV